VPSQKLAGQKALAIVQDCLRCGLAQFELSAHFLQARSKPFNLLLLLRDGGLLLCGIRL